MVGQTLLDFLDHSATVRFQEVKAPTGLALGASHERVLHLVLAKSFLAISHDLNVQFVKALDVLEQLDFFYKSLVLGG